MKKTLINSRNAYHLYRNRHSLFLMLKDIIKRNYRLSLFTLIVLVIGIIYTISPIDLIPDFIPLIGWIDDGALIYLVLKQMRKEVTRYNSYGDGFFLKR